MQLGGARVPDEMHGKMVLEAIACTTQLDQLVMVQVNGKMAAQDV
jgi:hypothetical protein